VKQTIRAAAGAGAGDTVERRCGRYCRGRYGQVFGALSYSHQKEYVDWIAAGKAGEDAGAADREVCGHAEDEEHAEAVRAASFWVTTLRNCEIVTFSSPHGAIWQL
jgi:hypothetical protein